MLDIILNQGFAGVVNLVRAKEEIAFGSLLMKFNRALQRVSPQNTAIDLDGVPLALAASGTYAGITIQNTAATGFVWKCNGGNGPTDATANSGKGAAWYATGAVTPNSTVTQAGMNQEYIAASYGNEEPTLILTTNNGWIGVWNTMISQQRFIDDEETTRAGFRNLMFNRAVVLRDMSVPAGEMQFYTEKYIRVLIHRDRNFHMDPFMKPSTADVAISRIFCVMQLQFMSLRSHSRVTGILAA
jgi:hypothetical protein